MFEGPEGDGWFHAKVPCKGWPEPVEQSTKADNSITNGFVITWIIQIISAVVLVWAFAK